VGLTSGGNLTADMAVGDAAELRVGRTEGFAAYVLVKGVCYAISARMTARFWGLAKEPKSA
jgi:hypothetical protein